MILPPSLPVATVPASYQCVTKQGAHSQTVCLQSDKKDGPEGEGERQSEGAREGGRERHSGNISKLDLAGENSRYLIARRLDSINAGGGRKAGVACECVFFA